MRTTGEPLAALLRVRGGLEAARCGLVLRNGLVDLYAADSVDQAAVAMAIHIGHAEALLGIGRPHTVARIAAALGIPRPTVYRYLTLLMERGVVEHHGTFTYSLVAERANSPAVMAEEGRIIDNLLVAGREIARAVELDTCQVK